jgi:hypothetical protein
MVGRGKLDGNDVAGARSTGERVRRKKVGNREARVLQKMTRRPRAIVFANDVDSHVGGGNS